ncbi:MAG: hypothetical protein AB1345_09295 [Chloroflexota bacterium]
MRQIEDNIYLEDSFFGVTLGALVFSHGIVLIDTPPKPEDARSWRNNLQNLGTGIDRLLVYLDAHPDRTLGGHTIGCAAIAHEDTLRIFDHRSTVFRGQPSGTGAVWETCQNMPNVRWHPPQITFSLNVYLQWGGYHVKIEHHRGPSPGAAWAVIPEAKIVFVGDTVVINQPPFLHAANIPAWINSLSLLLKSFSDYTVISGRGGLAAREVILSQQRFLKELQRRLDHLGRRKAPPEALEKLIPTLLSKFNFPGKYQDLYTNRIHSGLTQYYQRRYLPSANPSYL